MRVSYMKTFFWMLLLLSFALLYRSRTRKALKCCSLLQGPGAGNEGLVPAEEYKLLNVHVLIHHGVVAPRKRFSNKESDEPKCQMDLSCDSHFPKIASFAKEMAATSKKLPKDGRFHRWSLYPSHRTCSPGQLTERGAVQQILNGIHFSRSYQKHGLFDLANWHVKVLAHTTVTSRTFQSATAFLYGLLPNFDIQKINLLGSNNINFCEDSILGSVCRCLGLDKLRKKAYSQCRTQIYIDLMEKYGNVSEEIQSVLSFHRNKVLDPDSLADMLNSYSCHNLSPPCHIKDHCQADKTSELLLLLSKYQSSCLHTSDSYKNYAKVTAHGLLKRITREMDLALRDKTAPTFHLYSGHDTILFLLMTTLNLSRHTWPEFASRIVFELYRQVGTDKHVIRVLQNGIVVTDETVFCQSKTTNGFCDFQNYQSYVNTKSLDLCNSVRVFSAL